jgi:lipopolysaccharide export system protein LptA
VATRKISDLTLLGVDQVSSSDTLLLLDNSDPTDQNKRSAVGSIFTAVPSGTYTAPGVRFEGKTATGVFSETQGQVGLAMGNARLNLQKVGTTLNIEARDDADTNLDFTISAQGTGKIRLGSILAINDLNFIIPNSIDETKVAKFSSVNLVAGLTNIYSFPSNQGLTNTTDELVTLKATQTLEGKTIVSPTFTGDVSVVNIASSGNTTLGSDSVDTLTVNATSTFATSATFSNSLIINQGMTVTGDMAMNSHIDMVDDKSVKLGTDDDFIISYTNATDLATITTTASQLLLYAPSVTLQDSGGNKYFKANTTDSVMYHGGDGSARVTTTATGINIGGAIDAVTSITGSGDIAIATDKFTLDSANGNAVFGGNITGGGNVTASSGTTFQLGSSSSAKLGVGRAASTYNLEVEGSIYSTGSTIIAGNGTAGKFILQKGAAGIGLHFTDNTGTDQAVLDSGGNFGVGKSPSYKLDVSGDSWIDGDLTINTTNPAAGTGGKISAREIVLTDSQTGSTATLNAATSAGVSRAKVFFQSN